MQLPEIYYLFRTQGHCSLLCVLFAHKAVCGLYRSLCTLRKCKSNLAGKPEQQLPQVRFCRKSKGTFFLLTIS